MGEFEGCDDGEEDWGEVEGFVEGDLRGKTLGETVGASLGRPVKHITSTLSYETWLHSGWRFIQSSILE